jgi:hypothetical protein
MLSKLDIDGKDLGILRKPLLEKEGYGENTWRAQRGNTNKKRGLTRVCFFARFV